MAYYLEFDGTGYISNATFNREFIGDGTAWDFEFRAANTTSTEFAVVGRGQPSAFVILRNDNTIDFLSSSNSFPVNDVTDPNAVYRFEFRILAGNNRQLSLYENGNFVLTRNISDSAVASSQLGYAVSARPGALYYISYKDYNNFSNDRFYDPSASFDQGVLVDTVGGNNGTPVNFPANFNDSLIFYDDGGGAVAQPVVSINAEEVHQANTIAIPALNSVSAVVSEQVESANLIDVFLSQLASSIQAQETHDATALNIEQSASQLVNSISAEQVEQANLIGISQSLPVNSVQAQENQQANTLTIEQSAGQSISLNTAQQVEQGTVLSLAQQQALAHIVAEQLSDASFADVSNLQAVTMIIAEETHHANTLNVEQYTGQFVTLITAEQKSESQKLLISEVSAIDVLQAEQVTNAETMAFNQVQRLTQITAEQLTEAQLLTILTSGDNTDLSGLRLIPVTSKYTINPTNTTRYSLQKV